MKDRVYLITAKRICPCYKRHYQQRIQSDSTVETSGIAQRIQSGFTVGASDFADKEYKVDM